MKGSAVVCLVVALASCGLSQASSCGDKTSCTDCTDDGAWVPGMSCRWCPVDNYCHQALSVENPCSQTIDKPSECGLSPSSAPATSPSSAPNPVVQSDKNFVIKLVQALLSLLKITDVDASTCVNDVSGTSMAFDAFMTSAMNGNWTNALPSLSAAVSDLSTSINDCNVPEVKTQLDALAAALKWADVKYVDDVLTVLLDSSNVATELSQLAKDIKVGNFQYISQDLQNLLNSWTAITKGCSDSSTACKVVDGLLKILQVSTADISACEAALSPAVEELEEGFALFNEKNYSGAVADVADGLDLLAKAVGNDACGLSALANVLETVVPSLKSAIVTIESSEAVKIVVGSADVYDDLYQAAEDIINKDYSAFGMQMGKLLTVLQTSGCETEICIVLTGLLQSLELEADDFLQCSSELDAAWDDLGDAISKFQSKDYETAISDLGSFLTSLAEAVQGCGISQLGQILENVASKLGDQSAVNFIGDVVQVLVEGGDVTLDIQKLASDFEAKQWTSVGADLGSLADWIQQTGCKTFVCNIVEGLLEEGDIIYSDVEKCEASLRDAEDNFVSGAKSFRSKQYKSAIQAWAAGLNSVAQSAQTCGLESELSWIEQEANVFGFGNVSAIADAVKILVHGADYYEEFYSVLQDFEAHDYKSAGSDLKKVLDDLSQWTSGHACTLDICYLTIGILEFMGDFDGSFKECSSDLKLAWGNFSAAYTDLFSDQHSGIDKLFHFSSDDSHIKKGIGEIGDGLKDVAASVTACHLEQFVELLTELATKLGIAPEISWIEELLKIVIEGVNIETEIGDACVDYSQGNWVGFGYNIAKLIKTLL